MPAVAEHAAPTSSAPVSPSSSISAKPATAVPTIAPTVLAAYSCWNAPAIPDRPEREEARQRRQGRAHQHGRRREREDREREAHEGERDRRVREARIDAAIGLADEPEAQRRQDDDDDEGELEDPVHPQRPPDPVGDPPADEAADREPAEEPGEDRRHGLARVAEHEHQLPRPDHLVDQAGRPGEDEQQEQRTPGDVPRGHRWYAQYTPPRPIRIPHPISSQPHHRREPRAAMPMATSAQMNGMESRK